MSDPIRKDNQEDSSSKPPSAQASEAVLAPAAKIPSAQISEAVLAPAAKIPSAQISEAVLDPPAKTPSAQPSEVVVAPAAKTSSAQASEAVLAPAVKSPSVKSALSSTDKLASKSSGTKSAKSNVSFTDDQEAPRISATNSKGSQPVSKSASVKSIGEPGGKPASGAASLANKITELSEKQSLAAASKAAVSAKESRTEPAQATRSFVYVENAGSSMMYEKDGQWILDKMYGKAGANSDKYDPAKGQQGKGGSKGGKGSASNKGDKGGPNSKGRGRSGASEYDEADEVDTSGSSMLYEKEGHWILEKLYRKVQVQDESQGSRTPSSFDEQDEIEGEGSNANNNMGSGSDGASEAAQGVSSGVCGVCNSVDPMKAAMDAWIGQDTIPCNLCDTTKKCENDLAPLWLWVYTMVNQVAASAKEYQRTMGKSDASSGGEGTNDLNSNCGTVEGILVSTKATQSNLVLPSKSKINLATKSKSGMAGADRKEAAITAGSMLYEKEGQWILDKMYGKAGGNSDKYDLAKGQQGKGGSKGGKGSGSNKGDKRQDKSKSGMADADLQEAAITSAANGPSSKEAIKDPSVSSSKAAIKEPSVQSSTAAITSAPSGSSSKTAIPDPSVPSAIVSKSALNTKPSDSKSKL